MHFIDEARSAAAGMQTLSAWRERYSRHDVYSLDSTSVWIHWSAKIGRNVFFFPLVQIRDACTIGNNVTVDSGTIIDGNSMIDDDVQIGVRNTIRRAIIGRGTRVPYDAALIDFECGEECNIARGVTVSNFGGLRKRKVVIGNGCFVGTDVNLVAPLTFGDEVRIFPQTRVISKRPIEHHAWVRDAIENTQRISKIVPNRSFKIPGHFRWLRTTKYVSQIEIPTIRTLLAQICPPCKNENELAAAIEKIFPSVNSVPFFALE